MERTSSIRRKTVARQHKGEVMIAGEQLRYEGGVPSSKIRPTTNSEIYIQGFLVVWNFISRLRLHDGKLIKDRRYHLRTYPNCFVAEELIDWLVSHKEAPDRATAVCLLQHLMDHDIIHHGKKEATTTSFSKGTTIFCTRKTKCCRHI